MLLREHCAWRIVGARHATLSAPAPPRACRRCLVAVLAAPCRHVAISPLLCCVFMLRVYADVASLSLSLFPPTPPPPQPPNGPQEMCTCTRTDVGAQRVRVTVRRARTGQQSAVDGRVERAGTYTQPVSCAYHDADLQLSLCQPHV
jgi:hypothetical protein